jgi:hypothetical protein
MDYMQIAESPILYILVGVFGIGTVLLMAVIFLRKSWIRANELGYSHQQLKDVVKSSLSFSLIPSLAIVIGFFSLAAMLGVPWPWYRLSVVGSVGYEIMAADMALSTLGKSIATATASDFTLIMYVMSLSITGGLITILFLGKRLQEGTLKLKEKDNRWGALGNSCFMLTIVVVLIIPMILEGGVSLLTLLTSAIIALLLSFLIKKGLTWLTNFVLAICLVGAMSSSVLWTNLLA